MKNVRIALLALSLTAAASGAAMANDLTPKTREQVRAELAQAQNDGTLIANSETGMTFRQLYPSRYPAAPESSVTREEVKAELAQAQIEGTLIANSETGLTLRQMYPSRYPAVPESNLTRDEVKAELAQAQRNGTLIANGHTGDTYRDLYPSRYPSMNDAGSAMLGMAPLPQESRMN